MHPPVETTPVWSTSCPDWERRIVAGESLILVPPLFPAQAELAMKVFGQLRMVDVVGQPTVDEAMRQWAMDFARAVFGAYSPTGRRLINEFMLLVAKKNGKSTIAAAIMLTALILNWRPSGEFIILSPTKEVADNSYKPVRDMIAADEELSDLFQVQTHLRTVTKRDDQSNLKVVAADSDTVSGKKAIGVFVDELHEFGKRANAGNMLLEAVGGLTSRPEGFVIYATTQSESPPCGVFKEKLSYARKVRDGLIDDPTFLPALYEFPPAMVESGQCRDLRNAYITNPNWGASVDVQFIEKMYKQYQEGGEEAFRLFLAKHLNVEIGLSLRSDRWAGAEHWEACADPFITFDELIARSEVIVAGIDGGGLDDLLGLVLIGRERETRRWLLWAHAWAHKIVLDRRKGEASTLLGFQRDGDLTVVNTPGQDVAEVADIIATVHASGLMPDKLGIGVDTAGIGDIVDALTAPGMEITADHIIGISQGWRLNGAIKTAERKLAGHELIHGGRPMMAWAVGNAKVEARGNAITITKQISGSAKIDPVMAAFNAVSLIAMNPQARERKFQLFFV